MPRSLPVRLLALSLAAAGAAAATTAWLTTRDTSETLRVEIQRTLETDATIYRQLLDYAAGAPDWTGVGKLVESLAAQTGQRIALTTPDGFPLADSAAGLPGGPPPLPGKPAAVVDPFAPALNMLPADAVSTTFADGLTEEERAERSVLVKRAASCLSGYGYPAALLPLDSSAVALLAWEQLPGGVVARCVPVELADAGAEELEISRQIKQLAQDCQAAAVRPAGDRAASFPPGPVPPEPVAEPAPPEPVGAPVPAAPAPEPSRLTVEEEAKACLVRAERAARDPYVADPAFLFLGTGPDRFEGVWDTDRPRTVATVATVLLATALVTVIAGRRLVQPIHTMTEAVQRMKAGDRTARVPARGGGDEIARLGEAFNEMAASIEQHDAQRQAMVSDVAHELRNPLANVRGYLEAAEDGVVKLDGALVGSLLEETRLLSRVVDDLQDLALADAGRLPLHPEPVDAADLVAAAVAAHQATAVAAGITLTAVSPGGPVLVEADPARLRQALGNLVGNALRYTPPGGRVTVTATSGAAGLILSVADTGAGIAPEHLPHLFDRFYRADTSRARATGGSGLGLAITRHLVEAHGGRVTVESLEGNGSTFTITLPLPSGG